MRTLPITLAAVATFAIAASAQAATVVNANFDSGNYEGFNASTFDIGGTLNKGNPTVAGNHALPIFFENSNDSQFFMYYTLSNVALQAGDVVTLTYDVRSDYWDGFARGTDFRARIMANGSELGGQDNLYNGGGVTDTTGPTVQFNEAQYRTYTLTYTVPNGSPAIGQNVYPQFDSYGSRGGWNGADWFERTLLDNVVMTVTPIPEPAAAAALFGAGLIGLISRRRRTR
jgi:hypothetical protein